MDGMHEVGELMADKELGKAACVHENIASKYVMK